MATKRIAGLACAFMLALPQLAGADDVPMTMTFTARILHNGAPAEDSVSVSFKLFDSSGGDNAVWQEPVIILTPTNGLIIHELGKTMPLTQMAFNGDTRYLEITVNGTPMAPRVPVVSVPYAIRAGVAASAETLGEYAPEEFVRTVTPGAGITGGGSGGEVTVGVGFGGSGVATTVARSDHDHAAVYAGIGTINPDNAPGLGVRGEPTIEEIKAACFDEVGEFTTALDARYAGIGTINPDNAPALGVRGEPTVEEIKAACFDDVSEFTTALDARYAGIGTINPDNAPAVGVRGEPTIEEIKDACFDSEAELTAVLDDNYDADRLRISVTAEVTDPGPTPWYPIAIADVRGQYWATSGEVTFRNGGTNTGAYIAGCRLFFGIKQQGEMGTRTEVTLQALEGWGGYNCADNVRAVQTVNSTQHSTVVLYAVQPFWYDRLRTTIRNNHGGGVSGLESPGAWDVPGVAELPVDVRAGGPTAPTWELQAGSLYSRGEVYAYGQPMASVLNIRTLFTLPSANARCPSGHAAFVSGFFRGQTGDQICAANYASHRTCEAVPYVWIGPRGVAGSNTPNDLSCSGTVSYPWPWALQYGVTTNEGEWNTNTWVVCCRE